MTEVRERRSLASYSAWGSPFWAVAFAAVALGFAAYGFASGKNDFRILLVAVALVLLGAGAQQRLRPSGEVSHVLGPDFLFVMALGGFLEASVLVVGVAGVCGAVGFVLAGSGRATKRARRS